MEKHRLLNPLIQVFAACMIFGGIVRVLATERVFSWFGMETLWTSHPYFLYVYRILGGFVMVTGTCIFLLARHARSCSPLFRPLASLFLIIALIMIVAAFRLQIPWYFSSPDYVFCLLLALLLYLGGRP